MASVSKFEILTRPRDAEIGTRIKVEGGKLLDVSPAGAAPGTEVTVASLPGEKLAAKGDQADTAGKPSVGVALAPLSPELREQLELPEGTKGAVVANVMPDSPAERAGLAKGDIIVGIGNTAPPGATANYTIDCTSGCTTTTQLFLTAQVESDWQLTPTTAQSFTVPRGPPVNLGVK